MSSPDHVHPSLRSRLHAPLRGAAAAAGLLVLLLSTTLFCGCKEGPVSNGLDSLLPRITVYKPSQNDTVSIGSHEILYDVSEPRGITTYELVVNDSAVAVFDRKPDGSRPPILWAVDTASLNARVQFYIRAYDIDRMMIRSAAMQNILISENTSPPGVPRHLVLTQLSPGTVNLLWEDNSNNEDAFEVWRKRGNEPYQVLKTVSKNAISTNDTGLVASLQYSYRVRAVNRFGYGESNEASTSPDVNAPVVAPPTDLNGTALSTTAVELTWTDNATNELTFVVERKVSSGSAFTRIAILAPNTTTFMDNQGLFSGSSYTYRVAAGGQFGQSTWSNEATVLTLYQDINPPTNLRAGFVPSPRGVVLTWSDNSVLEMETHIERRMDSTGSFREVGLTGVDQSTFRDSVVEAGHTYFYRVRIATSDQHYSVYSNLASAVVPPGTVAPGAAGQQKETGGVNARASTRR